MITVKNLKQLPDDTKLVLQIANGREAIADDTPGTLYPIKEAYKVSPEDEPDYIIFVIRGTEL